MSEYVLGFAFSGDSNGVVLISKQRPEWQAGKLNGVGGRIEDGEQPTAAMVREFAEETGVETSPDDWRYFGEIRGTGQTSVYLFKLFDDRVVHGVKTMTDEMVRALDVLDLARWPLLTNVPGLIALALDPQSPRVLLSYGDHQHCIERLRAELQDIKDRFALAEVGCAHQEKRARRAEAERDALKKRQAWIDQVGQPAHPDDERLWIGAYLTWRAKAEKIEAELESLHASVANLSHPNCQLLLADKRNAEAELDTLREDAERWRFWRWHWSALTTVEVARSVGIDPSQRGVYTPSDLDAVTDAAINAARKP